MAASDTSPGDDRQKMVAAALAARQELVEGLEQEPDAAGHFVRLSLSLAEQAGDSDLARQLLADTRAVCYEHRIVPGLLWSELMLARLCVKAGDAASARDYATSLSHHFKLPRSGAEDDPPRPSPEEGSFAIVDVASHFYYSLNDFETTAALARMAVDMAPALIPGYLLLGYSLGRLEKYEESGAVWEKVIALIPDNASAYVNYAGTKSALGRDEEAIPLVTKAIELDPSNIKYRHMRAQLHRAVAQYDAAIADYRAVVDMAEKKMATEAPAESIGKSHVEYERNMPVRDVADFARVGIADVLYRSGRGAEAMHEADELIRTGDDPTRYFGYMFKAHVFTEEHRAADALDALNGALGALKGDKEALRERADLYRQAGRLDEAIADLALLADRERDPKAAAEMLGAILEEHPDHPLALKWRGFAFFESWRPSKAVADLERASALLPDDWQVHLWHGLSLILFSPDEEERAWSEGLTYSRIYAAIEAVGQAARLSPGQTEPLAAYKWLVDRVTAEDSFVLRLSAEGDKPNGMWSLIPGIRDTLRRYFRSFELARQRQWTEAADEIAAAQTELRALELPVFAARLDVNLADNYLRLYRLQDALDCLERAEKLPFAQARPLTAILKGQAEEAAASARERGQESAAIELDYMGVYGIGHQKFDRLCRLLKGQVLARLGDTTAALEALGNLGDFFDDVPAALQHGGTYQALLAAAMIVRDAGDLERALELLGKIEPFAETPRDAAALANTQGGIHEALGHLDEAGKYFSAAHEHVDKNDPSQRLIIDLNLAQNRLRREQAAEALELLDGIDIDKHARSRNDALAYYQIRARVLFRLKRYQEADAASDQAIAIAETMRENVRLFDQRITLLNKFLQIYRTAILIALGNLDITKAFDLVEKSKARAFLDQMAAGHLPLPEEGKPLQAVIDKLRDKQELLQDLQRAAAEDASAPVDLEAVARLSKIDSELKILADHAVPPRVSMPRIEEALSVIEKNLPRLERDLDEIKLKHWDRKAATVLTVPQIGDLLSEGPHHEQRGASGAAR